MSKTIITVVGKDAVIIAKICTYLAGNDVNVEDRSRRSQGYFNMMMIVDTGARQNRTPRWWPSRRRQCHRRPDPVPARGYLHEDAPYLRIP